MPYVYVDISKLQAQDEAITSRDLRPLLYEHPDYKKEVAKILNRIL